MGRPLHIAHGVLSLDVGGLERIVLDLVRAGVAAGHRVTAVCVERPGALGPEAEAAGAGVVSLGKPAGWWPEYIDKAAEALAGLRPDVVHTHQVGAALYLGRAAKRLAPPLPVVHTEHGNHVQLVSGWRAKAQVRLRLRAAAPSIDRFCCVSPEIAASVGRWWTVPRGKIEVVPNGVPPVPPGGRPRDEVRRNLGIPPDALVVGTVGRLAEEKRQDILIHAVSALRPRHPDLRLVLVGEGPQRPKLEAFAAGLRMADRVVLAGYQSRPDEFLRAMDVFSLTSRSEGFPVSLLEAWRAGAAVAAAAVGGIPAVVADGADGLLFPPGDPTAAAAAIGRLLDDPGLRGRLAEAGRRAVADRYALDRVAAGYEARYRALAQFRV
ncbi:MAG: glycosyltransferase [Gemmataceae bacterium]|nr:glycosyltransferase [Gemmataceae bacterium]